MKEVIEPRVEREYQMPTRVIFGRGILGEMDSFPEFTKDEKVILVAGEHFKKSDHFSSLKASLLQAGIKSLIYEENVSKSDFETINSLTSYCRNAQPDLIIAIGGGTVLDTAKCAAILAINGGLVEDYVQKKVRELEKPGITFIALPTTAGTGSEVTPWATVWDTENKKKYSLASPLMFPDLAIVDPALTDSLPPKITAETGIDALAQAVEAYWSANHNPVSDKYALEAIKLVLASLEKAARDSDMETRNKMSKGSLLAGLAFSNTQTTICHSVSYPMTAHFNVPHGQAVSITLPSFLEYTLPVLEPKRRKILLEALSAKDEIRAKEKIALLMEKIGLATKLSQLGIKKENIPLIVQEGFHPDRAKNAPRIPTPQELQTMLEEIL